MKRSRLLPSRLLLPCLVLTSLAAVPRAGGELFVVAEDGSGAFLDIQPAVDAAADGDTVLVREGGYRGFHVLGKAVRVIADGDVVLEAGRREVPGGEALGILVRGTSEDQLVVVRGIEVASGLRVEAALVVEDCAGPVWVEDCALGTEALEDPDQRGVAWISGSRDVVLDSCSLGGESPGVATAASGILAHSSHVYVHDSEVRGVPGSSAGTQAAFSCVDGQFFAAGCTLTGPNGELEPGECSPTASGGAGVELEGSLAYSVGNSVTPGFGDCLDVDRCGSTRCSPDGEPIVAQGGSLFFESADLPPVLVTEPLAVAGLPTLVEMESATPGSLAFLLLTSNPSFDVVPTLGAALLAVGQPSLTVSLGVADNHGHVSRNLTTPPLPTGVGAGVLITQVLTVTVPSVVELSSGSAITVVAEPL